MVPHSDEFHAFLAGLGYEPTLQEREPVRGPAQRIRPVTAEERHELELRSRETIGYRPFGAERVCSLREMYDRLEVPR